MKKTGKKVTAKWKKAVSGADKYVVYYKVGSKEYKTTVKKTTKTTLKNLKSGKKYKVRIQARKSVSGMYVDSDPSAYSKTVKVK